MLFLKLALKSLLNRRISTFLTTFSIALSVALLLSVERTQRMAEEGFTKSVSGVDLLVGARTGPVNLILFTVFNMGQATNNITWQSYEEIKAWPQVLWTIPYSLGDSHRGFRVVATDENFYRHYQYRSQESIRFKEGEPALGVFDVVLGSKVHENLGYKLGDQVVIAHGVTKGQGVLHHDDKPFRVVGILEPTGTAIDQSLYISLYGMEAIHMDWQNGIAPKAGSSVQMTKDDLVIKNISAFFLRTKNRIETLKLQRDINEYTNEPLLAIIPGVTLSEVWRALSQLDRVLKWISLMVLLVGLAAMVSTLLAGLNERRREMAILRSVGAGPGRIQSLLVFESTLITGLALILGVLMNLALFALISSWLSAEFGFYMKDMIWFTRVEAAYLLAILVCGALTGFIPAIRASRQALKDGLSVQV